MDRRGSDMIWDLSYHCEVLPLIIGAYIRILYMVYTDWVLNSTQSVCIYTPLGIASIRRRRRPHSERFEASASNCPVAALSHFVC